MNKEEVIKQYFYIDCGSPLYSKLHILKKQLAVLPPHWRQISREEALAYISKICNEEVKII